LPTTEAHLRAASRVELVELVIGDHERAARVRALYIRIEELMLATKKAQAAQLLLLGDDHRSEEAAREAVRKVRDTELGALKTYVGIQMELRRATTPEEFARLDAIR
jgi:hypothetical protein